jgi:hypothetical protein
VFNAIIRLDKETKMICLAAILINLTAIPFNKQDFKSIARSQIVCAKKEGCVKNFQKREQGVYRVLCGKKEEFSRKEFDKAELDVILYELRDYSLEEQKDKLKKIGVPFNE